MQEYRISGKWRDLLSGFFFAALAMLAKGPIGLAVPAIALGSDMLVKRQWKQIFDWRWIVGAIFLLIVLLPMLYGLYQQYDLHPEKVINGEKGVSGLKFFFWTQSFGRITGENTWHNDSSPSLFFVHTYLWSFAPWSLLLLPALWQKIRALAKLNQSQEYIGIAGFLIPIIVLSFSHYKLPHYIYVTFPFAALALAGYLISDEPIPRFFVVLQWIINILLWILSAVMAVYFFPLGNPLAYLPLILALGGFIWMMVKTRGKQQILWGTLVTALFIALYYNFYLSPALLQWPADSRVAEAVKANHAEKDFFDYKIGSHVVDFKLNEIVPYNYAPQQVDSVLNKRPAIWLFTDEDGRQQLQSTGYLIIKTLPFKHFGVNEMSWDFINPKTRESVTRRMYLIEVKRKP
jgi:4-amino-4-deoxy-L-arabinose transferase-like glycosyltransferase